MFLEGLYILATNGDSAQLGKLRIIYVNTCDTYVYLIVIAVSVETKSCYILGRQNLLYRIGLSITSSNPSAFTL